VIAAIGFGWLLTGRSQLGHNLPRVVSVAPALAVVAALIPGAKVRYDIQYHDLQHERARAGEIEQLRRTIVALGGIAPIKACGQPTTGVEYASALAYYMQMNVGTTAASNAPACFTPSGSSRPSNATSSARASFASASINCSRASRSS
jgi:hypothetical protein